MKAQPSTYTSSKAPVILRARLGCERLPYEGVVFAVGAAGAGFSLGWESVGDMVRYL
jgi:hypothetical protein